MTKTDINEEIIETMFGLSRLIREKGFFNSNASNLTLLQFHTLLFIYKQKNVTMGDIATSFSITLPTATTLINKLISANLIERKSDQNDRRIVRIVASDKGKEILKETKKIRNKKIKNILSYLSADEKIKLLYILDDLQKRMEEEIEK
jgi:DNA-binding MarR family transcriptional regulator